ncbi:Thiamine pyrophosphate-requiring enzyme [Gaiella occulta]|uniref:Thiamine pyrophosphate-requiring enzyme n=1 Tax=Gaiella occulta TaxID=1002870 RepID=A0A7M2YYH8_9ACTN|nr:thiamine pyrophosphate-binding protein [Gaiella occulta]RDI75217.1 Thiamine pyrophosphate-requiring enzyme [Gaiella occulta]
MGDRLQGGHLVAQAIAAAGVDVVFTLSGGHVMPIYEGCRRERVRVVDVRHEQSAAHAAEAWGRVRRQCGVAVVTAGPGVTGTVTAVANASAAQVPLLVIGGARPLVQAERGALQEFDQLSIFKPITKWAGVCAHASRLAEYVAIAFRHALATPRGPVYLELPMDVLFEEAEADAPPVPPPAPARVLGDPDAVERAAALLARAERPAVVAGSGVWWDGGADALARLAEALQAPVFLNGSGRGSLPPDHPLFFQHARSAALDTADAVLVVGATLDFRLRYGRFGTGTLVHVHGDPRELGRNRVPDVGIAGDCATVLDALAGLIPAAAAREAWLESLRETEAAWWAGRRHEIESDAAPLHHYRLGAELDRVLDPGTVVIGDGGDVVAAVSRVLRVHRPGHWLDPGPFGCLGVGPGYALGAGLAGFGEAIVVVMGDGAFGLNGMDFDTLVRFGVPAVLVVGNDAAWGEIRIPQVGIYGREGEVATRLAASRYDRLCEVFGGHAEHVERASDLRPALERALAAGRPAIVNVMLDPDAMAGHAYRGM